MGNRIMTNRMSKGERVFVVSFNCDMSELGEFNDMDTLCPSTSIDREYKMETGIRKYVYPIRSESNKNDIKTIVEYWKPKLSGKKFKFSITHRIDNSEQVELP